MGKPNGHHEWSDQQFQSLKTDLKVETDQGQQSFFDQMPLQEWSAQLQTLRVENPEKAAQKELDIIAEVKIAVSKIPYERGYGTPEQMISGGKKNCEGATILGSIILDQLKITHKILTLNSKTDSAGHVLLVVLDSMNNCHWVDMTGKGESPVIEQYSFLDRNNQPLPTSLAETISTKDTHSRIKVKDAKLTSRTATGVNGIVSGLSLSADLLPAAAGREKILLQRQALILKSEGKIDEAISCLEHIVQLGLETEVTLHNLGTYYALANNEEMAIATFTRLCESEPLAISNWDSLANAHLHFGNSQSAEESLRKGISQKEGAYLLYGKLARLFTDQNRTQDAATLIQKFIDNNTPSFCHPYLELTQLYISLGQKDTAGKILTFITNDDTISESKADRSTIQDLQNQIEASTDVVLIKN